MVGCVHIATGAAVGAVCIRLAPRLQTAEEPLSVGDCFKFFGIVLLTSALALVSHFVCDFFTHTEYWQMGAGKFSLILLDIYVFCDLVVLFFVDTNNPIPAKMCVASGVLWAAFPDGVWATLRLFPETSYFPPAVFNRFHAVHSAIHAPVPTSGLQWWLLNQMIVLVIAAFVFNAATDRRSP